MRQNAIALVAACTILPCAAAQAQIDVLSGGGTADSQVFFDDGSAPFLFVNNQNSIGDLNGTSWSAPLTLTNADHPLIQSFDGAYNGMIVSAPDRFHVEATSAFNVDLAAPYMAPDTASITWNLGIGGRLQLQETAQVRITFDFATMHSDSAAGGSDAWRDLDLVLNLTSPTGTFSDIRAGTDIFDVDGSFTVEQPFSFVTEIPAGDEIVFGLSFDNAVSSGSAMNGVEVFSQSAFVSFTVEVVPAPGAASLMALGGLVAVHRRRRA